MIDDVTRNETCPTSDSIVSCPIYCTYITHNLKLLCVFILPALMGSDNALSRES